MKDRSRTIGIVLSACFCIALFISCEKKKEPHLSTFNSELSLTVYSAIWDWDRIFYVVGEKIGETPANSPLVIPESTYWWVEPQSISDWEVIVSEVRKKDIPGLNMIDVMDTDLAHLEGVENLRFLGLRNTRITDNGLAFIKRLKNLQYLDLAYTEVSDDGLKHLERLNNLKVLFLGWTDITDDGLANISKMENLEGLFLQNADITDDGLKHLSRLENLKGLFLERTKVTNSGLVYLEDMENLRILLVGGSEVTKEGMDKLKKHLTNIRTDR